jgi:hypothetical protein
MVKGETDREHRIKEETDRESTGLKEQIEREHRVKGGNR